ncbi:MAG: phosphoribosylformylglycinamidine synthase [Kiritimatiellia bacterium]
MKPRMLRGEAAFSPFRLRALQESVRNRAPELEVATIEATYVYLLDTNAEFEEELYTRLCVLLGAKGVFEAENGFFVTPRKGTISPWSSKATDILHNCGFTVIRRVERGVHFRLLDSPGNVLALEQLTKILPLLYDRMTEGVYTNLADLFHRVDPAPLVTIDALAKGPEALREANRNMGLALSEEEIAYLYRSYREAGRNPTDAELMMFGQVNSEHCRHKIFNAEWIVDGERAERSLFGMIRHTHERHPEGVLVAYRDNSSVVEEFEDEWFEVLRGNGGQYSYSRTRLAQIMKVETHNHPTAISPYPGAATGVGGEIRDEAATGIGARSKAGLCGFMVSNLRIPGFLMPWERFYAEHPARLATPLSIMLEGPLGGAAFGNEFGRPQLCGFFKTFEEMLGERYLGYHKPIMIAGGMGAIKRIHAYKHEILPGALVVQIGGPALRIGLGGGAASSMATGSNVAELDFDSVQRDNAEMQRRCQEVVEACIALGEKNPILSIHDLGAGGLANGCAELVAEKGGEFWLRKVPNEDPSMSPMEIWCCEAQERYVLAIAPENLNRFLQLCARERCPVAVIGRVTGDGHLSLYDDHFQNKPIDLDVKVILGNPPRLRRDVRRIRRSYPALDLHGVKLEEALERVLRLPAVADKTFLITIADRSVTGLVARDQMVGPYQIPISDVAVTASSYRSYRGEAMAMGERTCLAPISAPASGRMAVGEALTNIAAADIGSLERVKLSANWMCACGEEGEDADLFDTVRAVGMELCPQLGICIPVGKDSLSMRTVWQDSQGCSHKMTAPLSLVVSAFAPVRDIRKTVTPDLKPVPSVLVLLDLGGGKNRLGGSALTRVYNQMGNECPDLDDPARFVAFFSAIQELIHSDMLLAYHDRSDGGLVVTLAEMGFGGRIDVDGNLEGQPAGALPILFAEELGAVLQVAPENLSQVRAVLRSHGLADCMHEIGFARVPATRRGDARLFIRIGGTEILNRRLLDLQRLWSELTYRMQSLRDNPACAQEDYDRLLDADDPGLNFKLTFCAEVGGHSSAAERTRGSGQRRRPRVAILREQGVNGHMEMAAAFDRAGFAAVDVHMTDLQTGRVTLDEFSGLVACGGFSYGDVLGAGTGWAKSILFNDRLRAMFQRFFMRPDTFTLGVCNGCQMLAQLKEIIPGADHWPQFRRNTVERFEARFVTVEILTSPSIFLRGMEGARLGVPVAHGEGFAHFESDQARRQLAAEGRVVMRFVDNYGRPTERYPYNPNGSPDGIAGVTTRDGRVTILMPHPERGFRAVQMSYRPPGMFEGEDGPWMRMFYNARGFVG